MFQAIILFKTEQHRVVKRREMKVQVKEAQRKGAVVLQQRTVEIYSSITKEAADILSLLFGGGNGLDCVMR